MSSQNPETSEVLPKIPISEIEFKSGLTWRSFMGILYSLFVFSPAVIYLSLVTIGVSLGAAIEFCTLLFLVEFTRFSGKPLMKQEGVIVFHLSLLAGAGGFLNLIYRMYYATSSIAQRFGIAGNIPTWWAPLPETGLWDMRTFFHPAWIIPLAVNLVSSVLATCGGMFFGLLGRELYIEGEKLPFPIQDVSSSAIVTLTERHKSPLSVMMGVSIVSLIYGALLYTIPTASSALGYPIHFLPIPWFDFYLDIERFFPGASLGIATDLLVLMSGMVLPTRVVLGMFAGSFAVHFVANWLLVHMGWTGWATRWVPGMDITMIYRESTLYFWACPLIGISIAVGVAPILMRPRFYAETLKSVLSFKPLLKARVSGKRFSPWFMLFLFTFGCVGAIVLDLWLVPDFPLWALTLFEIAFPFLIVVTSVRMIGITGQMFAPPYLRQMTILFSGYPKIDGWFLPMQLHGGGGWTQNLKICQLTQTDPSSWIKAWFLAWPLGILLGFIYTAAFWQLAPIPSVTFPAPAVQWPVQAIYQSLWITRPAGFFDPYLIISSFGVMTALSVGASLAHLPISMISIAAGANTPIPVTITMLLGYTVGRIVSRFKGEEWFKRNKATLGAGLVLGEGVAIIIGVAIALIARSMWVLPY